MLYEDTRHNCVFVGFDTAGMARYGFVRSSSPNSTFLRDVDGSDKRYSFHIGAKGTADTVYLFESAIDLLSYITLEMDAGRDWRGADYLSLSGIYAPQRENQELPLALAEYLRTRPEVRHIALCLDNDMADAWQRRRYWSDCQTDTRPILSFRQVRIITRSLWRKRAYWKYKRGKARN